MITEDDLLARIKGLQRVELAAWVSAGWVQPARQGSGWIYREIDLARVRLIQEIRHDFGIDEDALPLILSLIDQIYGLRRELRQVCAAVQDQPDPVRHAIAEHVRHARERVG